MTGTVQTHRGTRTRSTLATPAVTPIARAVRHALAASVLALALAAPATSSIASECRTDTAAIACRADASLFLVDDPTLVADIAPPSAVVGGPQVPKLTHDSSLSPRPHPLGTTDLVHDGVIDVVSATGEAIGLALADDEVFFTNLGSIAAHGYTGAIALSVSGGEVLIDNDGAIFAEVVNDSGAYAPAIGVRVFADDALVRNGSDGTIGATAFADGGMARARGIYAVGFAGGVDVTNDGDIDALAQADGGRAEAHGIYAFGYGGATTVDNAGTIDAVAHAADGSAYATGINAIGYGSGANVSHVGNTGSIHAQADGDYAYAFGVLNLTRQRYGSAEFTNNGDIFAHATGGYATATGVLNMALRYGNATTTNTGTIEAVADGTDGGSATGLYTYALVYDAIVDNGGAVAATASGEMAIAVGIHGSAGFYGDASVLNSGTVAAIAEGGAYFASAIGVAAVSENITDLTNYGDITVVAEAVDGPALAAGLYGVGSQAVTVRNYGTVSASATSANGDASAYGALAFGGYTGTGLIINAGDLLAQATAGAGATAYAVAAYVTADVASIFNDGSATAVANADGGTAIATAAWAYGIYAAVSNYGELAALAQADGGSAHAHGAETIGYFGASTTNSGDIQVQAIAIGGDASAAGTYTLAGIFTAYTINSGDITASAIGDSANSYGVLNAATYIGDAITINSGTIVANAEGGIAPYGEAEAIAWGVYNLALVYGSYVVNSGSILAQATATADIGGTDGFLQAKAIGAAAMNVYGYWDTGIINYGDIGAIAETSQGYASAWGVVARSGGAYGGDTFIDNAGLIQAQAHSDIGIAVTIGAYVASLFGDASVTNAGDIVAYSRVEMGIPELMLADMAYATGVYVRSPYGAAAISNTGSITGHVSGYGALVYAAGIQAFGDTVDIDNAEGASIVAIAELDRFGFAGAAAVEAHGAYGVTITNAGDIVAYGSARGWEMPGYTFLGSAGAIGIYGEASFFGDVAIANTGSISAVALASDNVNGPSGAAGAVGIHAYAKYDATVVNAGDIFASATTDLGNAASYGVMAKGKYTAHVVNGEGATIISLAQTGSQASDESAGRAAAFGVHVFGSDHGYITNDGVVIAHATATADDDANLFPTMAMAWGLSIGAYSDGISGLIVNHGDVEAMASADFGYATAYGANVQLSYEAAIENSGSILAVATADHGDAFAVGAQVYAVHFDYYVPCTPTGCDYSNPVFTPDAGEASLVNAGTIVAAAYAEGGIAHSYGVGMFGGFGASVANVGEITALAEADEAFATGVFVAAPYGSVTVDNAGTILAAAYGAEATAIGVRMVSTGTNTLVNTGTIAAQGDGARIAISSSDGAIAALTNFGTLRGAIVTGALADTFDNAAGATWHALDTSDFGAGSDRFTNLGTVVLDDAIVRMTGGDDVFTNAGAFVVRGDNVLDLGSAFVNNGAVSFADFAADDTLFAIGGLAGTGTLRFDVSGATRTADWLRIDGDVDAAAVQTIDVILADAPGTANFVVPLVGVSGTSVTGNFALGDVWYDTAGFLTLDFALQADIDAGNTSDDVFSLGVEVTGLSATGSLAAAVAPGAQALVDAQVGSWRQRSGALPAHGAGGLSPWLRLFAGSGDLELAHDANFGPGGEFGFHQSTQGWELGVAAQPNERLGFGLLFATSEGDQRLDAGAGNTHLDGRTVGLFGTWRSAGGFYLDVSQRWTAVDARLDTVAGPQRTDATVSTFNLEAGLAGWTVGGLHVAPQLQLTHSSVADVANLHAGSAVFVDEGGTSRRARLGLSFDKTFEAGEFLLVPYGSLNVVREFDGEYVHTINGGLHGANNAEGTGALVEVGLGARRGEWTFTGSMNRADGGALEDVVGGQLTVRRSW